MKDEGGRMKLGAFLFVLALLLFAGTVSAQGEVTADDVNAVAKQLYCPVCENEPLDQCGTKACQDWRAEIRLQLEQGATEQEIKDSFQNRYGDRVLAEPPREGANWILWLLPVVFVVFGGIWFARYLRQLQAVKSEPAAVVSTTASTPSLQPPKDDYVARIEDELRDNE